MSGVIRKKNTGDAWETVLDTGGSGGIATAVETPAAAGNTDSTHVTTGDSSGGDGGNITIQAGDGDPGNGAGGDILIQAGAGDTEGVLTLRDATNQVELRLPTGGHVRITSTGSGDIADFDGFGLVTNLAITGQLGFFNTATATQQTITGVLSTVADAPAKALLTSIIAALAAYGIVIDGTT